MPTLEQKRLILEEVDVIESEICKRIKRNPALWTSSNSHNILGGKKKPLKETLLQQHEIKLFLDQLQEQCTALSTDLVPIDPEVDNDLAKFDKLHQEIREFHTKYPQRPIDNISSIYAMYSSASSDSKAEEGVDSRGKKRVYRRPILSSFAANLKIEDIFTDEEHLGNYLDLVTIHQSWLNLPGNELKFSYSEYLDIFSKLPYPNSVVLTVDRGSTEYLRYVKTLSTYLKSFYVKIQPLGRPQASLDKIEKDFSLRPTDQDEDFKNNEKHNYYELLEDGGVNCFVCDKKFTKFSVFKGHATSNKHQKKMGDRVKSRITPISEEDQISVLKSEYEIKELSQLLARQISATRTNVERKMLLTDYERSLELDSIRKAEEDDAFESSSGSDNDGDDDDEENTRYNNPLKLPLGADGKPIPYWLFKLNGLGLEFSCEVCGNTVYQGRKKYVSHFGESKHLNGLKFLGVDTSLISIFKGISRIEDVLKLKERYNIKTKADLNMADNVEEMEDEEGYVMSKRDYEDLKKQGLL